MIAAKVPPNEDFYLRAGFEKKGNTYTRLQARKYKKALSKFKVQSFSCNFIFFVQSLFYFAFREKFDANIERNQT